MAGEDPRLYDPSIAVACAVEDRDHRVDGDLELMEVLPDVHRPELLLVLHLDIRVEGDEGLAVVEAREHVGDRVGRGIVGLRLEVLEALTLVEL